MDLQQQLHDAASTGRPVELPPGDTVVDDNLYWHGNVSIVGTRESVLLLVGTPSHTHYWICGGTSKHGAKRNDGVDPLVNVTLSGITVRCVGARKATRLLNVLNGHNVTIDNVFFDIRDCHTEVGAVGCYNNAAYSNPCGRSEITVRNCEIVGDQTRVGSEAIGIATCSGIVVTGNKIEGVGDDAIGIHICDNVVVSSNRCSSRDGRILMQGCQDWVVSGNTITRTGDASGGAYIMTEPWRDNPSQNGSIIGNVIRHSKLQSSPTYGMRIRGTKCLAITGNAIFDESEFGYGIWIEDDGPVQSDGVTVNGNTLIGRRCNINNVSSGSVVIAGNCQLK
jgi:hypothetical protein